MSLRFGCFEDNEGVGVAPSTSRAASACGGVGGSSIYGGRRPHFFFARISRLGTTMRAVGIEKSEPEIVQIILRQYPERYDVVKTMALADNPTYPLETIKHHPFRLLPTQGPQNCETRAGGG